MKHLTSHFFKNHWPKILSIFLFILLSLAYVSTFAVFYPGETLNPDCAPGGVLDDPCIVVSGSVVLGETSTTAYRGDRGKIAYDHTLLTNNPHLVTLDGVMAIGNSTTRDMLTKSYSWNMLTGQALGALSSYIYFGKSYGYISLYNTNNSNSGNIRTDFLTGIRDYLLPDNSGTIALTTDIPISLPTPYSLTINNSGSGDVSGFTFNGSTAKTISYNSIGAQVAGTYSTDIHSNITALNAVSGTNTGDQNLTGLVPYTGATGAVNLGAYDLTVNGITVGIGNNAGWHNTAIGMGTLDQNISGYSNSAIGAYALNNNTTGFSNNAIGEKSLANNTIGSNNVANGYYAGLLLGNAFTNLTNISNSLFIGANTMALANGDTNEIVIGDHSIGHGSNTATWGNTIITDHYFTGNIHGTGNILGSNLSGTNTGDNAANSLYSGLVSSQWTTSGQIIYNNNTGNVGIGTTNPSLAPLQVVGDIYTTAGLGFYVPGEEGARNAFYRGGTDFQILRNYTQPYTLQQIWSPPGTLSTEREATLALVRGDEPNQEYIDIYNNGYVSETQFGIRIQKRGTGVYRDFVFDQYDGTTKTPLMILKATGNVGIGTTTPTAILNIKAGSSIANGAPLKFTSGALLTTPEEGAVEFDNSGFYGTTATAPLAIGDSYGGGKIAYILQAGDPGYDPTQVKGIIAATADQSTGIIWATASNQSTSVPGTSTDIGTGLANTDLIIAQNGAGDYAAGLARAYTGGGYSDWYLPSRDELNKLDLNKAAIGGFDSFGNYWSSSEDNLTNAWAFFWGAPLTSGKGNNYYVRAVRSFAVPAASSRQKFAFTTDIPSLTGYVPYTGATTNVDLGIHNLTVDTNSLFVDATNHNVGIGTTAPAATLDINGNGIANSLNIINSTSQTTATTYGLSNYLTQTTGGSAHSTIGTFNSITYSGPENEFSVYGRKNYVNLNTTGTVAASFGDRSTIFNNGAVLTSGEGVEGNVINTSGTLTTGYGVLGNVTVSGGKFNKIIGVYSNVTNASSDVTNNDTYGFYSNFHNNIGGVFDGYAGLQVDAYNTGTARILTGLQVDFYTAGGTTQELRGIDIGVTHPWTGTPTNSYGIYIDASTNIGTSTNYSIYSASTANSYFAGNVGIGTTNPGYKLEVGSASVTGVVARFVNSSGYCDINPLTTSLTCTSDMTLKKNITTIKDDKEFALQTVPSDTASKSTFDKLMTLTPIKYNWNGEPNTAIKHVGFIAQEVEQIFPDLVFTDSITGIKSVAFTNLIPYTIEAIQEMNLKLGEIGNMSKSNIFRTVITSWLGNVENGITDLYASVIHSDKVVTKEIEMKDSATGEEYCVVITNGEFDKKKGKCGAEVVVPHSSPSLTPEQIEAARVAKIDTDLATAKTTANNKVEADYTGASWSLFTPARTLALALPEIVEAQTQAELEANKTTKTNALNNAMTLLVLLSNQSSDITALTDAKDIAQGLIDAQAKESANVGDHVAGSLTTLIAANGAATGATTDTQAVIDAQVSALNTAIGVYNVAIVPAP